CRRPARVSPSFEQVFGIAFSPDERDMGVCPQADRGRRFCRRGPLASVSITPADLHRHHDEGWLLMADADRSKALDNALAQIDKSHGKGAVMRLGHQVRAPIEVIPTGAVSLDIALGIGGLPRGRVVEIYGPESSGKTTVALRAVARAHAQTS